MNARFVTDPRSFRLGTVGPSTGEIWLAFGNIAFPTAHWNDFVVVILEAWAAALLRIIKGSSHFERVHFMDGPYEVTITRAGESMLQLRALERGSIERACINMPARVLLADLLEVAQDVISACEQAGDTSIDAERLERIVADIRTEVAKKIN